MALLSATQRCRAHGRQLERLEVRRLMSATPSTTSCVRPACQYRFRAFALSGGRSAEGIEASPMVASRDFSDLAVTLPTNLRVRSRVG